MEHIRKTNRKLGVGARGVVYEGYDEEHGRFVAVKEIPFFDSGAPAASGFDGTDDDNRFAEERRAIVREISLMERIEHPNLVAYYGARRSAVGVQIIMECVNGSALDTLIRRQGSLRESVVRSYTRDVLEGLAYLHDTARICHRDVKPANVLITCDGRCKLTDFGVSKLLDEKCAMHTTVGTPWYMAPEVINGTIEEDSTCGSSRNYAQSYTTAADIWSLGVTVFEMISGRKPFGGEKKHPTAVLFAIASADAAPPQLPLGCDASASLRGFLELCFVRDARLRPRAAELLLHQWFYEPAQVAGPSSSSSSAVAAPAPSASVPVPVPVPAVRRSSRQRSAAMLDTADLLAVAAPRSTEGSPPARSHSGARESGRMQSGFLCPDGHFVDLIVRPDSPIER